MKVSDKVLERRLKEIDDERNRSIAGTACEKCRHSAVCKYSEELLAAQEAINDASIVIEIHVDGMIQYSSRPVASIDCIEPVKLRCKHANYSDVNFR